MQSSSSMAASSFSPHALLIEDDPLDSEIERITLEQAGFTVISAQSLVEGETCAMTLLGPSAESTPPVLVLLDLKMPDPGHPDLEGAVLAAALHRRMQLSLIRPAWLIALTSYLTFEREEETLFAGCHRVLSKPLTNYQAAWLRQQVEQPPPLAGAQPDVGFRLYQEKAEEILSIVRRGQLPRAWTSEDARHLLSAITSYPYNDDIDQARQAGLLMKLGGRAGAHELLRKCAERLGNLDRLILLLLLEGHTPDYIHRRRRSDSQLAYDRTTVFRHIQKLPESISIHLR
jgi:CheY-like chemotaxis protein